MTSVSSEYALILSEIDRSITHSSSRQDSNEFQTQLEKLIRKLALLRDVVNNKLYLFSINETLEDLATSSIKYLAIDYHLSQLHNKRHYAQPQEKMENLLAVCQMYLQFLTTLHDYQILDPFLTRVLDKYNDQETKKNTLDGLIPKDQTAKRAFKIELFNNTRAIETKAQEIQVTSSGHEEEEEDDERIREHYILQLQLESYKAFSEIEQNLNEYQLLSQFAEHTPTKTASPSDKQEHNNGYTEKLENINKPLLSSKGKVLRNFTLIDKKTELMNKVKGYGQYGPTMTVDEFLQKELEQNNFLQNKQEQKPVTDEDDNDLADRETYKAREWDDFKESHPKGSGNTINRG